MQIELTINGERRWLATYPDEKLLDLLRRYGYMGVKKGCGEGTCGSCVILLDGKLVNSCILFAPMAAGRSVTTIEGLGTIEQPHFIQKEFVGAGAVQCGFCTPGMVLATKALLDDNPDPSEQDIKLALDGNLCRCTGYKKIIDGVERSARVHREILALTPPEPEPEPEDDFEPEPLQTMNQSVSEPGGEAVSQEEEPAPQDLEPEVPETEDRPELDHSQIDQGEAEGER